MPAPYPFTSWAHRTHAMCKGTLKLVESDFFYAHLTPDTSILCESTFIVDE